MKVGGQIPWNVTPICETFKISCLMGRRPMKDVLGNHFKGPIIPFGILVEYHPISAKDQSRIHSLGKKVLPGLFLGHALYARGIWKGDITVADIEELETMDASEIHSKRLDAKGSNISRRKWKIYFSSRRWTNQTFWRRSKPENIHLDTASTNSRRNHLKTHFRMPVKR